MDFTAKIQSKHSPNFGSTKKKMNRKMQLSSQKSVSYEKSLGKTPNCCWKHLAKYEGELNPTM